MGRAPSCRIRSPGDEASSPGRRGSFLGTWAVRNWGATLTPGFMMQPHPPFQASTRMGFDIKHVSKDLNVYCQTVSH